MDLAQNRTANELRLCLELRQTWTRKMQKYFSVYVFGVGKEWSGMINSPWSYFTKPQVDKDDGCRAAKVTMHLLRHLVANSYSADCYRVSTRHCFLLGRLRYMQDNL